ncbi:NaeI family type II restriction endonuclease [Streptomyces syringium]|uniref:NaeI family type II restriction endonuclease n=1 Tax=Streptomyces syringium TaxID=76729 RepID=UPI003434F988
MYLRSLRDAAGLSVEQLHLLLPDMLGDTAKPGLSTLHRRLRGADLKNHRGLVTAVVDVCVADATKLGTAHKKALSLLKEAWQQPVQGESDRDNGEDCAVHLAKLVQVQEQLLEARAALGAALQAKDRAEAELDARTNSRAGEHAELRRRLLEAMGERDVAQESLRNALQRITNLEGLLAAARPSPTPDREGLVQQGLQTEPEQAPSGNDVTVVREELLRLDPQGRRMAAVIKHATERLLDGEHTGRYRWDHLSKTEKTMSGQLVENLMRHEFQFAASRLLDFRIAGIDVDLRVTATGNWTIPREALGAVCLLIRLDHRKGSWSLGVARATEEVLARAVNRDGKQMLNRAGHEAIDWIHRDVPLPVNILERLPDNEVRAIFAEAAGQRRVNELFRVAQRQPVTRTVVTTVARQEDAPKRVRVARRMLADEGILILSHQDSHPEIARTLGLPVPDKGTWVSARLAPATEEEARADRSVLLSGTRWRLAKPDDEPSPLPASVW